MLTQSFLRILSQIDSSLKFTIIPPMVTIHVLVFSLWWCTFILVGKKIMKQHSPNLYLVPTFRLPVVMALTVGTRVAGILIPKRTCCDLFHLCWIAWLFSYFEVCLVCTTCQSQKYTILEVNIIYVLWFICSSRRRSSRVLSFLQFEEAEAWVRSCREVVVQSLESTIEECLAVTLRVEDFTESLRSWGVSRHILICTA